MKISELIKLLKEKYMEYGDIPVAVEDYNDGYGGAFTPTLSFVDGRKRGKYLELSADTPLPIIEK